MTGRTPRGRDRRALIVAAAADLLARDGLAGVTYRAVSAAADVPLGATTYYFRDHAELLAEALRRIVDDDVRVGTALVDALPRRCGAQRLADVLLQLSFGDRPEDGARSLTLYEVYVQAGRDPRLREIARQWSDAVVALVMSALARGGYDTTAPVPQLVSYTLDGLALEVTVEARDEPRDHARRVVLALLRLLPRQAQPRDAVRSSIGGADGGSNDGRSG